MSITHTFPPPSSPESFSKIFSTSDPKHSEDPWANGNSAERRPEDVIYTLNSTIENIESRYGAAEGEQTHGEGEGVRWEIIQEGSNGNNGNSNVHHLDGQPRNVKMNLEELVAQFKPFRAPPPPVPFPEYETAKSKQKERKAVQQASSVVKEGEAIAKPKQKTFTTTITVTESTYANGRKTYTASSGPIISQAVQEANTITTTQVPQRLTRRERVRKMQQEAAATNSSAHDAGLQSSGSESRVEAPRWPYEQQIGKNPK